MLQLLDIPLLATRRKYPKLTTMYNNIVNGNFNSNLAFNLKNNYDCKAMVTLFFNKFLMSENFCTAD